MRTKIIVGIIVCFCFVQFVYSQNGEVEIKGTVLDDDGQPAISVVIRDKTINGKVYGVTDLDGNFSIKANPNTSLNFSGLSYEQKTVKLNGKRQINVVIPFESQQLSEVVVTAKRLVDKFTPEPTDIEIVGNQYIIRPKVKVPKELFKPNCRIVVQPVLVNQTKGTDRYFKPAVVTGKKYKYVLDRMLEFKPDADPLSPYYTESKRANGNEIIAYTDSLFVQNPDDEYRCDIFMYMVKYSKRAYQDTAVIAKGTVNPMRFFNLKIGAKHITAEEYIPKPKKQMRGDKGEVKLTFLVNSVKIDDSDPQNNTELNKISEKLKEIDEEPSSEFTSLSITGISSPEGIYYKNLELAHKRTQSAGKIILAFLKPETERTMRDSINTKARVESWNSVADLMEKDSLNTNEIRNILNKYHDSPDQQSAMIARLPEYQNIIKNKYLKLLRRVEYSFNYSVFRKLNDTEIKQLYDINYKKLAQYEFWRMFVNAKSEKEKEKICRQALEIYPDFMFIANELAVILIDRGEPDSSLLKDYISENAPEELLCNHIVSLLHDRDYKKANMITSLLPESSMSDDILALCKAYSGDYQAGYDYFAKRGGTNEVVLLLAMKRDEEAYDKASELPDDALSNYLKATAANRLDKLTEAFSFLKRAISEDSRYKDIARLDGDVTDLLQEIEEETKSHATAGV